MSTFVGCAGSDSQREGSGGSIQDPRSGRVVRLEEKNPSVVTDGRQSKQGGVHVPEEGEADRALRLLFHRAPHADPSSPDANPLAAHRGRGDTGQLFVAYEDRETMSCVAWKWILWQDAVLSIHRAHSRALAPELSALTLILRPCISPSRLTPNPFISGAFLLLRTDTPGHSTMC